MQFLNEFDPTSLALAIAKQFQQLRIALNITQKELSSKSGVSVGSIKRFEKSGLIALKHLLHLAVVLDATHEFTQVFPIKPHTSIEEMSKAKRVTNRQRARRSS